MEIIQKVVLNPLTNSVIFVFESYTVAFTYNVFLGHTTDKNLAYSRFIEEFSEGENASLMSKDISMYAKQSLEHYQGDIDHQDAFVVYSIENGFGLEQGK